MNIVPRDGGNTLSGSFSTSNTTKNLQANNLNDGCVRGLAFSSSLKKHYDGSGAIGGPVVRIAVVLQRIGSRQPQFQQGNYFNKLQNQRVRRSGLA